MIDFTHFHFRTLANMELNQGLLDGKSDVLTKPCHCTQTTATSAASVVVAAAAFTTTTTTTLLLLLLLDASRPDELGCSPAAGPVPGQ